MPLTPEALSGSWSSFPITSFSPCYFDRNRTVICFTMRHLDLSPAIMFIITGLITDEIGLSLFNL